MKKPAKKPIKTITKSAKAHVEPVQPELKLTQDQANKIAMLRDAVATSERGTLQASVEFRVAQSKLAQSTDALMQASGQLQATMAEIITGFGLDPRKNYRYDPDKLILSERGD